MSGRFALQERTGGRDAAFDPEEFESAVLLEDVKIGSEDTAEGDTIDEPVEPVREAGGTGVARSEGASDSLRWYMSLIGRVALLDAEQEVKLAKRVETGLVAERILYVRRDGMDALLDSLPQKRRPGRVSRKQKPEAEQPKRKLSVAETAMMAGMERWAEDTTMTDEELEQAMADGTAAKNWMIEANLRLVVNIARRYIGRGMAFLDLIQEGNTGLIRAVEKFDYTKGYKFSTYAKWWVHQAVKRGIADQSRMVRIPAQVAERLDAYGRVVQDFSQQNRKGPTSEYVAEEMDVSLSLAGLMRQAEYVQPTSYDMPLNDGDANGRGQNGSLIDILADPDAVNPQEAAVEALQAGHMRWEMLRCLGERDADIVWLRYVEEMQIKEIGARHDLSRASIDRILRKSLAELAGSLRISA